MDKCFGFTSRFPVPGAAGPVRWLLVWLGTLADLGDLTGWKAPHGRPWSDLSSAVRTCYGGSTFHDGVEALPR
ncbi:MAG: hypothetical protein CVU63_04500 [Deltaproteobacteria bacterium HGW-Deltaproteobacteria-20]|nr:MAG: hypothetical protein CVU63_04500 [Deltaproteobacteria bacterium HGW-Deltaproteobacteria-20]